ncbi:hypothetical protein Mapa_002737 [Marchantia paleacea]|nr:hypothetical protein Mapa_002737 [Marchantia paleacea]
MSTTTSFAIFCCTSGSPKMRARTVEYLAEDNDLMSLSCSVEGCRGRQKFRVSTWSESRWQASAIETTSLAFGPVGIRFTPSIHSLRCKSKVSRDPKLLLQPGSKAGCVFVSFLFDVEANLMRLWISKFPPGKNFLSWLAGVILHWCRVDELL